MRDGKGPGCGGILAGLVAIIFVMYYGFHDTRVGWILKAVFVFFALIVVGVIALVVWIIMDRLRKDKIAEEEQIRRNAEQSLRHIRESRAQEEAYNAKYNAEKPGGGGSS